jgi:hypothetical protein
VASDQAALRARSEAWFTAHGLPYFVDDTRHDVRARLRRGRLLRVLGVLVLLGAAVGVAVGLWRDDVPTGVTAGLQVVVLGALVHGFVSLRASSIVAWGVRRTFGELRLLFPLVTRALPLLLLFVTFLFVNADVWRVSSTLDGSVMWLTVALFTAVTVAFLLVRLPEELAVFDRDLDPAVVVAGTRGTPLEEYARGYADTPAAHRAVDDDVVGLQRANLVLMLLMAQLVQVLLLSLALFGFFVVFGLLIIEPGIVAEWIEARPTSVSWFPRASVELVQVSVFLAAFSGLYFTVYAVTDEVYRTQFFTTTVRELQRAVAARAAYRALVRYSEDPASAVPPEPATGQATGPATGNALAHWAFVQDLPEDLGGGFVSGELVVRPDGRMQRRYGGSSYGVSGTSWRFGGWEDLPRWEPTTDLAQAKRRLRRRDYDLYLPGPVGVDERQAGPFPGSPPPASPVT